MYTQAGSSPRTPCPHHPLRVSLPLAEELHSHLGRAPGALIHGPVRAPPEHLVAQLHLCGVDLPGGHCRHCVAQLERVDAVRPGAVLHARVALAGLLKLVDELSDDSLGAVGARDEALQLRGEGIVGAEDGVAHLGGPPLGAAGSLDEGLLAHGLDEGQVLVAEGDDATRPLAQVAVGPPAAVRSCNQVAPARAEGHKGEGEALGHDLLPPADVVAGAGHLGRGHELARS